VYCILAEVFLTLTEFYPCFFFICKTNARVKPAKTGHGPHSFKLVVICVILYIVCMYMFTVLLPPGDNQIAVHKYIISMFVFLKHVSEIKGNLQ
jgi:hypothetical protein